MRLRSTDVLARVDQSGKPLARGGRVEIRYDAASTKVYHAAERNLEEVPSAPVLPDEHCADAADAPAPKTGRPAPRGAQPPPVAPGTVIVYADGACSGNPGPAGLGLVVIDGGTRLERSEYLGTATNNIAELMAVQRALEAIGETDRPVAIHTDSQYSIGVLSLGWKAKANQELIAQLRSALRTRPNVRFVHVRGHAGVVLNERADELAREAISHRRTVENVFRSPSTPAQKSR